MLLRRRVDCLVACVLLSSLVSGCVAPISTLSPLPQSALATATFSPPPPSTLPAGQKTLSICLIGEPDTLYLYGGSRLAATQQVMQALYDGPIDYLGYAYHPVILQRIPSIADGDVVTRTVSAQEGDLVVDSTGEVVPLGEGVRVRPAGCAVDECAVEFEDEPIWMEKLYVTFELREDITWADGEALTADDSLFAFEIASDPATLGSRDLVERTESYRLLDEYRIKWTGLPGFIDPAYFSFFFAPLPRHQLEGDDPEDLLLAERTRRRPLGWGSFVVEEWVTGEYMVLSRSAHYFRASEGLPYLDQVVFRFAADVPDLTARLLAEECDIGVGGTYADYEPFLPVLLEAEQQGLLTVVSVAGDSWEQMDMGIVPVSTYRRPDFFADVRVRQAVAHCIDREAIVDEVTYGRGVVLDGYLPVGHPFYDDAHLTHWDYDIQAGQALLEEVGWLDEDEDSVREARGVQNILAGTRFEVALLIPSESAASQQVARIIRTNLADCGIQLDVEALPAWELFADGPDGLFFGRQFDLVEMTRQFDAAPMCAHYMSSEIPERGRWGGSNPSGYSNPDYDAACLAALHALPGTSAYERYHGQAQALFSAELAAVPLFVWPRIALARSSVLNFALDPAAASDLWNIEGIDVE